MKKAIICLVLVCVFSFCFACLAQADEISELKEEIKAMQAQMEEMQKKIGALEAERVAKIEPPKELEGRVISLEEKLKKPWEGELLSLRGEKWRLGGELEVDFVATKKHAGMAEKSPHFNFNAFKLFPEVSFTDDIFLKGEIEFARTSVELKKMYLLFEKLPFNSFLKPGLDYRFIRPSRKTVRYPLAGNAFWRDSELGIFAGGEIKPVPLYWLFSYTSGLGLNQRSVTEDSSLNMLHDHLRTSNYVKPGEFGLGLGLKYDLKKLGKIDTLGFCYLSRISSADKTYLESNVSGYRSEKRRQFRCGFNFDYSVLGANLFAQLVRAEDGDLYRTAWYIQPSYKLDFAKMFDKPDWKFFYAFEPLFRYGALSQNTTEVLSSPLTWDREEFTLGMTTDIYKDIKLKTEYTIDHIDRGSVDGSKNYGEFVTRLDVLF